MVSRSKTQGREFFDDVGRGIFFALEGGFPDHAVVGSRDIALQQIVLVVGLNDATGFG